MIQLCLINFFHEYFQDFDPNSAFFTKVKNKKKNKQSSSDQKDRRSGQGGNSDDEPDELDPVVLRSRQLASK